MSAAAGGGSTASGALPAFVAGTPPIQEPQQSQASPQQPPPPPQDPATAATATAAADAPQTQQGVGGRGGGRGDGTGGSPGGRSGGRGRGGRHPESHGRSGGGRGGHFQGSRGGAGDGGGGVAAGGRNPSGGRHLYNPQQGGGGRGSAVERHPQPVQVHQASGLPHGYVPAYLPGSASLVEELDASLMVVMRDGRHLIGTLSSYDQFSNLVLEDTVERRLVVIPSEASRPSAVYYSDIPLGLYVVRGDSVVIMGRTDPGAAVGEAVSLQELEDIQRKQSMEAAAELDWDVDTDLVA